MALPVCAGLSGVLYLCPVIAACTDQSLMIAMLGLAGLGSVVALAGYRANSVLARRLNTLIRAIDVAEPMLIVAPDGGLSYANVGFDRLFPPQDRRTPLDRVTRALCSDEETQGQFRRLCRRAAAGARATATLSLTQASGGHTGRFKVKVDPIAGYPGYCIWQISDVTAPYELEARIRDERDRLSDLLDNAPIGFYSVDGGGRFRFVNRTLAGWLDSTPSEMIAGAAQLSDFLATPAVAGSSPFAPFAAPGSGQERGEVVLKSRRGGGMRAWIGQNVVRSGNEMRTRSVVCDLTPEREWQAALRSAERFRRCFANAPVGIALLDGRGRFEEANQALADLFGVSSQNLRGRKLVTLLDGEDRDRIAPRLAAAIEGRADPGPLEIRLNRPGEKTMVLFISRIENDTVDPPVANPAARVGLTLHFIDVTERKNLEVQFAQSQKMQAVGQLAGGVAHDFNNLLTAMIGFCDLLLLRAQPGDPSFADIMQIKQNANRAANLVRQLLAFSRQQTLQPRVLNITDVLYELRHLVERLIGENIKLDVVHGRDLGLAKVDQGQLEQVIINLAVNARDAMPSGGTLTIRTSNVDQQRELRRGHEVMPGGDYVLIEMADTGIGIPKENLDRIFDPFFSTKEVGSGTGLGLSTVYGIVKQTGGFVFVSSASGQGAVFQIYLPRFQPPDGALPFRTDGAEPASVKDLTGQGTIMLVEDDDPVRIFGARALRNKGYKVIEAKCGEAALDLIRNAVEEIDLLITDVVMPHLDGPGLVREVREIRPELKVIFISGYTEDAFRQRLDNDSAIDFLPKPFSLKQLAAKVRDVIGGRLE
jgi:two-component system, cell cycle sensor histidine kinase and response regulator CckA